MYRKTLGGVIYIIEPDLLTRLVRMHCKTKTLSNLIVFSRHIRVSRSFLLRGNSIGLISGAVGVWGNGGGYPIKIGEFFRVLRFS